MKNAAFYVIAVTDGARRYAYAARIPYSDNLRNVFDVHSGGEYGTVEFFCPVATKAHALEVVKAWTETWEKDGVLWTDGKHYYYRVVWA